MTVDKHTLRANALAAMHSVSSLDWATQMLKAARVKIIDSADTRAEYTTAIGLIELEIEDEMSKCHEALTKHYAKPTT